MAEGQRIGYQRVSLVDQSTDRHLEGVEVHRTFRDKVSGKDTNRPQFQEAMAYLRDGDTLVVHSMDRLARNAEDLLRTVRELGERGVTVQFIKESLTFSAGGDDYMAKVMLAVFAEFERSLIRERQKEGIALAKSKGVYKGRDVALTAEQADALREELKNGGKPAELARKYGISRSTADNYRDPDWQRARTVAAGKRRPKKSPVEGAVA